MSDFPRPLTEPFATCVSGGGGGDTQAPIYVSSEIGDEDAQTVDVLFNEVIFSPALGYDAGVTIEVDTVGQTISAAVRQVIESQVHYTIPKVTLEQVITWEYLAASGDIEDQAATPNALNNVSTKTVTNNVGTHFRFNIPDNSGHLLNIGIM